MLATVCILLNVCCWNVDDAVSSVSVYWKAVMSVLPQLGCHLFGRQMLVKLADLVMKIYTKKTKLPVWSHYNRPLYRDWTFYPR